MRDLALFWRSKLVAALLEDLFGILVGNFRPFADIFRRNRDKGYFAILGRAELGLVIVEITGQRLRRSRIDWPGLRGVEFDVVHRTLLILEAAERLDQHFRWFQSG